MGSFSLIQFTMGMCDLSHLHCKCLHPSPVIPEALYNQRIEGLDWAEVLSYLGSIWALLFIIDFIIGFPLFFSMKLCTEGILVPFTVISQMLCPHKRNRKYLPRVPELSACESRKDLENYKLLILEIILNTVGQGSEVT